MSERNESTRICKCCGLERQITDYDLNNNGRPIGMCKKCRRAQQTVSYLRNRENLSTNQVESLRGATQWLELCHQATGYVSGSRTRHGKIDFADPAELAEMRRVISAHGDSAAEETKVCKCCGTEKKISEFDLSNTKKPISICKTCRRAQQQINTLRQLDALNAAQSARLEAAEKHMAICEAATGFVTNRYTTKEES